jgi:hypothetical protein
MRFVLCLLLFGFILYCCNRSEPNQKKNKFIVASVKKALRNYHDSVRTPLKREIAGYYLTSHTPTNGTISTNTLICNLEKAYTSWVASGERRRCSFENFCEYLLPLRVDQEPLETWRDSVLKDYKIPIDSTAGLVEAAQYLNQQIYCHIRNSIEYRTGGVDGYARSYSRLKKEKEWSCGAFARYGVYVFRAHGLPVAIDFVPQWGNHYGRHTWNALITGSSSSIPFMVTTWDSQGTIGSFKTEQQRVSKVYRFQHSMNSNSHAVVNGICNYLPGFFNNPFLVDVTSQYAKTNTITVISKADVDTKTCYLSVFETTGWIPVDWGVGSRKGITFHDVPDSIVFVPTRIDAKGTTYLNYPFVIIGGKETYFVPDHQNTETVTITRKYPGNKQLFEYLGRTMGARIQVTSRPDFADSHTIGQIADTLGSTYNTIYIDGKPARGRYVRYIGGQNSFCNLAEVEFYNERNERIFGKPIGTPGSYLNDTSRTFRAALDGDPLTFFDYDKPNGGWVGLTLDKPQQVKKVVIVPRCDLNGIVPGNRYELLYWDYQWISVGQQVANDTKLFFNNVPKNALLWLRNYTTGKEERIFTYTNGKQVWW